MFIDARLIDDKVHIHERSKDGVRNVFTTKPHYVFYYQDEHGTYTSIYGDKLKKTTCYSRKDFNGKLWSAKKSNKNIFESDVDVVNRLLEERYPQDDAPPLHISIVDIESDKDPSRGWAKVENPYAIINAITIRNKWENTTYTIAVPPENLTMEEATDLLALDSHETDTGVFGSMTEADDYYLVETEAELLIYTIELLRDADVITGWNSSFYDLPYIIQRIRIVLGGEDIKSVGLEDGSEEFPFNPSETSKMYLKQLGLFNQLPKMKMVMRFGKQEKTFILHGRIHLDYLELYRKFTFEELHQYTLDFILQKEIKESKVALEESLDKVYRNQFRTFIAYNRQDVDGLSKLDDKKKLIELANSMAHSAGVTLEHTLGTVNITEQAILRKLHRNGLICFDKTEHTNTGTIPGAFVVKPIGGLYDMIWSIDINSLYPSVIRAINISPEVVIGQFDCTRTEVEIDRLFELYGGKKPGASEQKRREANAKAWGHFTGVYEYHDIIDESDNILTLVIEGTGEEIEAEAKDWKYILRDNNWSISANGTVFDLSKEGIVTQCMTDWYAERQDFQKKKKAAIKAQETETNEDTLKQLKDEENYFDMVQMVKKIFLNATYGAYLNAFFRFYDPRLGKSVTLTGRCITKHMLRKSSELTVGEYGFNRDAIIYGDTDSAYCTLKKYFEGQNPSDEELIETADRLAEQVNESFPKFMDENLLIGEKRGAIIEAGREVVADHGLFGHDVKKRYALHVIDNEGKRCDKLKVMGMETRRSDTPKYIQEFLEDCISMVVKDQKKYEEIRDKVELFREDFRAMDPWRRGSPCRVSKLTINSQKINNYEEKISEGYIGMQKPRTHYSVTAANNTNRLMDHYNEHHWDYIHDGDKIEVLMLRDNPFGAEKVAIAAGMAHVPDWFQDLPFNNSLHEHKLIDKKLTNILGVLGWTFEPIKDFRKEVFGEEEDFFA